MCKTHLLFMLLFAVFMPWTAMAQATYTVCEDFESVNVPNYEIADLPSGWVASYPHWNNNSNVHYHAGVCGYESNNGFSYWPENGELRATLGSKIIIMPAGSGIEAGTEVYVILPEYYKVSNISFKAWKENAAYGTLELGYTSSSSYSTYHTIQTLNLAGPNNADLNNASFSIPISLPAATGYHLAFKWTVTSNDWYGAYVDNVCVTVPKVHIASTASDMAMTWSQFASNVSSGITYSGQTVYLDEDITASTMVGVDGTNCFQGHFEGQQHTITFNYNNTSNHNCGLFLRLKNSEIRQLKITGTINDPYKFCGGFAGDCTGTCYFTDCVNDVTINSTVSGDGTHGGFVAYVGSNSTVSFTACVFTGKLLGSSTNSCGGFCGYSDGYVQFYHCIFNPSQITMSGSSSATFSRGAASNYTINNNCYFSQSFGTVQGKLMHTVTNQPPVTMTVYGQDNPNSTYYEFTRIQRFSTNYSAGLLYDGVFYAGSGDGVKVVLGGGDSYRSYSNVHLSYNSSGGYYSFTMSDMDIPIYAVFNAPTNLQCTNTTYNSATLTWTNGVSSENRWQICVDNDENHLLTVYSKPYTLSGLNNETTYSVKVRALRNGYPGEWSTVISFTTAALPLADLPYSTDFETTCDWRFVNGDLTNAWAWGQATNHGGSRALYISNDGGTTNAYTNTSEAMVYATKTFSFEAGVYKFSFDWKANGESNYDYMRVALVPASVTLEAGTTPPDGFLTSFLPTGWIALDGGSKLNMSEVWQTVSHEIIIPTSGVYMMVFAWRNDDGLGTNPPAAIDNVNIEVVGCPTPTQLQSYINGISASLSWTENGEASAWQICLNDDEAHLIDVDTNPYILTGLSPETNYTAKVRANCGGGDFSEWSQTISLIQIPANLPYNTGFETTCDWRFVNGHLTNAWVWGEATNHGGSHALYISNDGGTTNAYTNNDLQAIVYATKLFVFEAGIYNFSFDWKANGEDTYDYMRVALVPASVNLVAGVVYPTDFSASSLPTGWMALDGGQQLNLATEWQTASHEVTISTSGVYMMVFAWCNDHLYGSNPPAAIDNVCIEANALTKAITGYGDSDGGYYLIAAPVQSVTPSVNNGFLTEAYDLYQFDQSHNGAEWCNYKAHGFDLVSGKGYLYASAAQTTLQFIGLPYSGNGQVTLSKTEGKQFEGWNLIGNPFSNAAILKDANNENKAFFIMNQDGSELVSGTPGDAIAAMEGVFVVASADGETVTFNEVTPQTASNNESAMLSLNISKNRGSLVDRAIVRFDQGGTLPKFQLNTDHTKVFFTEANQDYAVVHGNNEGDLPVSFKTQEDNSYTITVTAENLEVNYLHLIDNLTGVDVDLLQTPSYTFEAKTTDYESRFRLIYTTNVGDGSSTGSEAFAFFSNGNLIINNEGDATLQVIDMMGRVLSSEQVSGCCDKHLNVSPGVYTIRLINGNGTKVQKMVVR